MTGFLKGMLVVVTCLFIAAWPVGGAILGGMWQGPSGGIFGLCVGAVIAGGFIGIILDYT